MLVMYYLIQISFANGGGLTSTGDIPLCGGQEGIMVNNVESEEASVRYVMICLWLIYRAFAVLKDDMLQ